MSLEELQMLPCGELTDCGQLVLSQWLVVAPGEFQH